jgi:hypothetical protein
MKRIITFAALVMVGAGISVAGSGKSRDPTFHASRKFRDALQSEPLLRLMRTEEQAAGCAVMVGRPQLRAGVFGPESTDESMAGYYGGRLPYLDFEVDAGGAVRSSPGAGIEGDGESPTFASEPQFNQHFSVTEEAERFDQSVNANGARGRLPPRVRF